MAVSNIELIKSANLMIEHYGEEAELKSTSNADACLAEGDVEGSLTWVRIKLLVAEITGRNCAVPLH